MPDSLKFFFQCIDYLFSIETVQCLKMGYKVDTELCTLELLVGDTLSQASIYFLFFCSFFKVYFMYLKEREGETGIFHPLIHCSGGSNDRS